MRLLFLFIALGLASAVASAQSDEAAEAPVNDDEARALFEAGRAAMAEARYEAALDYFQRCYEISHRYQLLYNIGVAADRLRNDAVAADAFRRFLAEAPEDMPQRADAARRAEILGHGRPGGSGDGAAAGLAVTIGGAAVLAGGVVFLIVGQIEASNVENAPRDTPFIDVAGAVERSEWMRPLGWVLAGVGAAATAAGLAIMLTSGGSEGASARLQISPNGLVLAGRFQ